MSGSCIDHVYLKNLVYELFDASFFIKFSYLHSVHIEEIFFFSKPMVFQILFHNNVVLCTVVFIIGNG